MKTTPILFAIGLFFVAVEAHAEVSPPRMLADRPAAHCQGPRWSPDGLNIAYDVYDPKKDTRETWIVSFSADGRKAGDKQVMAGSGRARLDDDDVCSSYDSPKVQTIVDVSKVTPPGRISC